MTKGRKRQATLVHNHRRWADNSLARSLQELDRRQRRHESVWIQHYAVAFIDLLGASNALRDIETSFLIAAEAAEQTQMVETIQRAVRPIEWMRRSFNDYFARAMDWVPHDPRWLQLSRSDRSRIERWMRAEISCQAFSDCLALSVSLRQDDTGYIPVASVHTLIVGCAAMVPTTLAGGVGMTERAGKALRGGIAVGPGLEYFPGEITTSAGYVKAYELESRQAKWPRILVDEELVDYMRAHAGLRGQEPQTQFQRWLAERSLAVIRQDADGCSFLDFLSPALRAQLGTAYLDLLPDAYRFARREQQRFADSGGIECAEKYRWLVAQFDRALPDLRPAYDNGTLPSLIPTPGVTSETTGSDQLV